MTRRQPSPLSAPSGFKGPVLYPLFNTPGPTVLDAEPSVGKQMTTKAGNTSAVTVRSLRENGSVEFAEGDSRGKKCKRSF
ncbi:hypothetical protein NUW54_g4911 [Trametes sanguinea]|uniref:Uncharacterized protein n=1 Tax=Trametes sanguinea TaxID=158606 RepID=A0ACC1PXV1_9APHY|nr:hypothetical protein NUW54_g4911 [Trametes sanguinea]